MNNSPIIALFFLGAFLSANGQDTNKITGKIDNGSKKKAVTAPLHSRQVKLNSLISSLINQN
jgi:hypothetical protein